jgi:Na+-driven multidrug efflux pump
MIAAALSTNLMTFVDTLMVGQLGDAALGGVGIGGQLFFLLLSVALGLTAGVQAMVARRGGEKRLDLTGKVLNAGILLALIAGFFLIALGYLLTPLVHHHTVTGQRAVQLRAHFRQLWCSANGGRRSRFG